MSVTETSDFCIKHGYRGNPGPVYFLDDVTAERGVVFQPDVYTFAEWVAIMCGATTIIDIGCGWGDKLAALHERHPNWEFVGVDYGPNINYCLERYDWGLWVEFDLEGKLHHDFFAGAIVICSDVIEHLADPTNLLVSLKFSHAACIVLSTPERDLHYGYDHMGPSSNPCHVREWNGVELRALLEHAGLTVNFVGLTRGSDQGPYMQTQLVVCTP